MTNPSFEQEAHFKDHGWLVLRGVVCGEALELAKDAFGRCTPQSTEYGSLPRDQHGRILWQVPGVCGQSEALLAHIRCGLGAFAADLLGARRIQLLQDTLIVKPACIGASIALHQDYAHTGFLEPPNAVSIRLSLSASDVARGCMYVIDRSHLWGVQPDLSIFSDRLQEGVADRLPPEFHSRIATDRVALELGPGDVSIHHCLTFHGSFENTGDSAQKTIVTHLFDGACTLAPARLPGNALQFFNTDPEGHLSTASFPVMFERSPLGTHR